MRRHYVVAAQTDKGIVKQVNQDSLTMKVAQVAGQEVAFAVLCDGMGGLAQGEVASAHVVKAFEEWFYHAMPEWVQQGMEPRQLANNWQHIIRTCNQEIMEYAKQHTQNMGTTLTAILFLQEKYYLVHIGDCRVYEMTDGIKQITKDQTYVAREVALGHMTKQQAQTDSRRNVLLQCIGVKEELEPVFMQGTVVPKATYLLCSDGFRHEITSQEMLQFCHANLWELEWEDAKRNDINEAMNQQLRYLVELNKNRNEKDNISAVLIRVV